MKTLCFDIENVFVRKMNLLDDDEINLIKQDTSGDLYNFIVVTTGDFDRPIQEFHSDIE